jgi:hypothetical protein
MFTAMAFTVGLFAMHRNIMPSKNDNIVQVVDDVKIFNRDIHIVMRRTLPGLAFAYAARVSFICVLLHLLGLFESDPETSNSVVFLISTLSAGILCAISINAAKRLTLFEEGSPDPELRKGLFSELVVFPLLPVITAIAL